MEARTYQQMAQALAEYPDVGYNILYPAMGIAGEAGEVCDKVKKYWRNYGIKTGQSLSDDQKGELQPNDQAFYNSLKDRIRP